MKLNQRLSDCATALHDKQLLARLSSGDIIAQQLKCHLSCLAALYNRERERRRVKQRQRTDIPRKFPVQTNGLHIKADMYGDRQSCINSFYLVQTIGDGLKRQHMGYGLPIRYTYQTLQYRARCYRDVDARQFVRVDASVIRMVWSLQLCVWNTSENMIAIDNLRTPNQALQRRDAVYISLQPTFANPNNISETNVDDLPVIKHIKKIKIMTAIITPGAFQLSDIYPPTTITPKRLSFTSHSALTPKTCDGSDAKRQFRLDVAFLVGKTSPEAATTDTESRNIEQGQKESSPATTISSNNSSPESRPESSSDCGEKKNTRTKYTPQQQNTLENIFMENPYPDTDEVERLAGEIGVTEGKIRIWFQNKRARWRRRNQYNTQQQHLQPAMPPSTPVYPSMPPYTYMNMPPSINTMPFVPHHPMAASAQPATPSFPVVPTPNYPRHKSPASSPGSTSSDTSDSKSSVIMNNNDLSRYSTQMEKQNMTIPSRSTDSVVQPVPQIQHPFMAPFYHQMPHYSSYHPTTYSQFPAYY
ncbi:hypothetical protein ScPMuIL_009687 [Solemya velum]